MLMSAHNDDSHAEVVAPGVHGHLRQAPGQPAQGHEPAGSARRHPLPWPALRDAAGPPLFHALRRRPPLPDEDGDAGAELGHAADDGASWHGAATAGDASAGDAAPNPHGPAAARRPTWRPARHPSGSTPAFSSSSSRWRPKRWLPPPVMVTPLSQYQCFATTVFASQ